jgi:pyridoxamine 5'-phosphate oxidase
MTSISDLRKEYTLHGLSEAEADPDPIGQFARWFDQAIAAGLVEPNAMTLATVGADGQPSARVVLLKSFDARGFVFYTNYLSRKGRDLEIDPRVALVFYWPDLERQVRIEGTATRVAADESDAYFASRPPGSRIGAWASPQSRLIEGRESLEREVARLTQAFGDGPIARPPHWGGYRVSPSVFEFWQGRPSRLHDRLRYRRDSEGEWIIERLAP